MEYLARLVGRRDLQTEPFDDRADETDLLGVRGRLFARTDPERVLETHPDMPAHRGRGRGNAHLVAARAEHRPVELVPEQAVGRPLHVKDVLGMRADPAEDAEDALDEERR